MKPELSRQERILVAQLSGILSRHAGEIGRALGAAVEELRSVSTSPDLLVRALPGPDRWEYLTSLVIVGVAGGDMSRVDELQDSRGLSGAGNLARLADWIRDHSAPITEKAPETPA